jgi:hypothetical protein
VRAGLVKRGTVPDYRVTYHVVVGADDEDDARRKASEMLGSAGDEEPPDHVHVSIERIHDSSGHSSFVAEGVRRQAEAATLTKAAES